MRDQFKMLWVAAQSLVAQMIDLFLTRDIAEIVCVSYEMCSDGLTIETHTAIPTTSTRARCRPSPEMTWGCLVIYFESSVGNVASGFNLLDDRQATIWFHIECFQGSDCVTLIPNLSGWHVCSIPRRPSINFTSS